MSNSPTDSGIGPNHTSLLNKLGLKSIGQLSDDELRELVHADRARRVATRVAGRIKRMAADKPVAHRPTPTLESVGLAPALIERLRASGKSDVELIAMLKEKGVL